MSEFPTPNNSPVLDHSSQVNPDSIDAIISAFRDWLREAGSLATQSPDSPRRDDFDLAALVAQFVALRHEVNMQTKAARAAVEQTGELLRNLKAEEGSDQDQGQELDEATRPIAKAIVDIVDALTLSLRQMEKLRESIVPLLEVNHDDKAIKTTPNPGLFARLFGNRAAPRPLPLAEIAPKKAEDERNQNLVRLKPLAAAAADGYGMSLRRVERILPTLGLERIPCVGEMFDPETMEAVEVVGDDMVESGRVVEEIRPGYFRQGALFRFAQVKVAR